MKAMIYSTFLALILSVHICKSQEIAGTYLELNKPTHKITFEKGIFKEELVGDITTKKGFGNYYIKKNKLIFNYKNYPQQDTSHYELIELGTSPHSTLDVAVFDSQLMPMWGMYGCRDSKENILNLVATDKEGKGNMTIFDNKSIGYFTIDCIGYHRIQIPIKRIMGKSVTIKAYLKPQKNYYIETGVKSYQILHFTNDKLVLIKDGLTINFEKSN
ncbi:hypothetical protein [Pedobacter sp.]